MLDNIRSAFASIWGNKLRSLLTLLGVVIGVASVTTLVALGEGLKKDVSSLIQGFGTNVVTILPGKIDLQSGRNLSSNPANFVSTDILTLKDVESVAKVDTVEEVTPLSLIGDNITYADKVHIPTLMGAYPNLLKVMQVLVIENGRMFASKSEEKVIVLGPQAKADLFGDDQAIGKKVQLGKQDFEVIGVLKKSKTGALSSQTDSFSLIPFDESLALNKGQVKINRIVAKAADTANVKSTKESIKRTIITNHQQEEDFTVLTQDDVLDLFDQFLSLATAMVSAIASISLVVGGIGIMNIMLVTVTERTREIGLRKAVGATRSAILLQFLVESIVVTFIGGLIGLGVSFIVGMIIASQTPLSPKFSWPVIAVTMAISVAIGVIFGLWPALRAARKDPIEALRYE